MSRECAKWAEDGSKEEGRGRKMRLEFVTCGWAAMLFAASLVAQAAGVPHRDVTVFFGDRVFAHIADGLQWTTSFTLINIDTGPSNYTLSFFADDGSPLDLPIVGSGHGTQLKGVVPVTGSVVLDTAGGSTLRQGWAYLDYDQKLAGFAVFKSHYTGQPYDFEASVPLTAEFDDRFVIAFDNSSGYFSGIALVNPSSTDAVVVTVTFRNADGSQFLVDSFQMQPRAHIAFLVANRYPPSVGRRGSVEFSVGSTVRLAGLGLRFNPTGAITSTTPFSNVGW